jgi:hypothetical protein
MCHTSFQAGFRAIVNSPTHVSTIESCGCEVFWYVSMLLPSAVVRVLTVPLNSRQCIEHACLRFPRYSEQNAAVTAGPGLVVLLQLTNCPVVTINKDVHCARIILQCNLISQDSATSGKRQVAVVSFSTSTEAPNPTQD